MSARSCAGPVECNALMKDDDGENGTAVMAMPLMYGRDAHIGSGSTPRLGKNCYLAGMALHLSSRLLASGSGWWVSDFACSAGPHDRPAHRNSDLDAPTTPAWRPCRLSAAPGDFKRLTSPARYQVAIGQRLGFPNADRRFHEPRARSAVISSGCAETNRRLIGRRLCAPWL